MLDHGGGSSQVPSDRAWTGNPVARAKDAYLLRGFQGPETNHCGHFLLQLVNHPFDSRPDRTALCPHQINICAVFPSSDCAVIAGPSAYSFIPIREPRAFCGPVEEVQMIESTQVRRISRVGERIVVIG